MVQALQHWSHTLGDRPAFIFRHGRHGRHVLSWTQLYRLSGRLAALLRQRAVSRGQLVLNTLTNSPERVVCELAIWMSGAASVNSVCLLADGADLLRTLRTSRASVALLDPDVTDSPWTVLQRHVTLAEDDTVTSESLPDLKHVVLVRRVEGEGEGEGPQGDFLRHLETLSDWFQADDVTADDVMSVFTTSGTTGFCKLVAYTHGDYLQHFWPLEDAQRRILQGENHVYLCLAPLGFVGGYAGQICYGLTRVLCDVRAEGMPADMGGFILSCLQGEDCRRASLSPRVVPQLAQHPQPTPTPTPFSSKPLTPDSLSRGEGNTTTQDTEPCTTQARDFPHSHVSQGTGNTAPHTTPLNNDEDFQSGTNNVTSQGVPQTTTPHHRDAANHKPLLPTPTPTPSSPKPLATLLIGTSPTTQSIIRAALSVADTVSCNYAATDFGVVSSLSLRDWRDYVDHDTGRPLEGVQVKIVSQQDDSVVLPADHVGHVLVKTSRPSYGYLNDPESSAAQLTSEGFVRTGDLGRLDTRGHLLVHGRGNDVIVRGAYCFHPAWLESRIGACPGVRDVIVVGVPDPVLHQELCACVVLESGDVTMTQVREFVEREFAVSEDDPMCPRPRFYLSFQSFPATSTSKPRRKAVQQQAVTMLGLSTAT